MTLRVGLIAAAAACLLACDGGGDGGGTTDTDGGSTSGSSMSGGSAMVTTSAMTTGPVDCIPGQESCECLEGDCIGTLFCVENVCLPGPDLDVPDEPIRVIAGLRVPIEAEVSADEFGWEQTGGPDATLTGVELQELLVDVPAAASPGDVLTLTLTATRNSVPASVDVTIEVVEAIFEEGLPGIEDTMQLGTPTAIAFRGGELWAVMNEGFVSWFDLEFDDKLMQDVAIHMGRHDIPGGPLGARLGRIPEDEADVDYVLVANEGTQAVEAVAINGGAIEGLATETIDGEPLGPVRGIVRMDDELYFTNGEGGQLLVWDPEPPEPDGGSTGEMAIPPGARVLLSDLPNPSAITTGPEPGVLYVGTNGQVVRVPILEGGVAGDISPYLTFGEQDDPTLRVDGLQFDRALNLYVGVPDASRLIVARYVAGDSTSTIRNLTDAPMEFSDFVGLSFGENDFGGGTLYYGNASGRVGRVFVGLGD